MDTKYVPRGIGFNTIKRSLKKVAGKMAALTVPFLPEPRQTRACVFIYHRLAEIGFVDPNEDDWNVSPVIFEQQIAALAAYAEFVPLLDLPARLSQFSRGERPLVCLTFDDGYASVHQHALRILERYRVPATVFVITGFVGRQTPMPCDRWTHKQRPDVSPDLWRPMNWTELEDCVDSGLVTVGAHSHAHVDARTCSPLQMQDEVEQSRDILRHRLGESHAQAYSYPYGSTRLGHVPPAYVKAVRSAGYALAVCTDLGLVSADSDRFLLPRIEAHALDSAAVIRAKTLGALLPYRLTDRLRIANRSS